VEPGRLLAGEYPASLSAGKTAEKIRLLVEATVDLTTPEDRLDFYQEALNVAAPSPRASVSWSQGDSNHCVSCRKMPWPAGKHLR
jgi:hypothetical protein